MQKNKSFTAQIKVKIVIMLTHRQHNANITQGTHRQCQRKEHTANANARNAPPTQKI
ncbi:MAG: hypothetical protein RR374_03270 [Clostridia bacterium]